MRATQKIMDSLGLIYLLIVAVSNSVWAQDEKQISPQVKQLQQKRLEPLEEACSYVTNLNNCASLEDATIRVISAEYFAKRREQAQSQEQRIKTCEEQVQRVEQLLEFAKARKAAGRGKATHVFMYQAYLLLSQIGLETAGEAKLGSQQVYELQAERLEALRQAYESMKKDYSNGRFGHEEVREVMTTFFEARRAHAETQEQQIKAVEEEVKDAEVLLKIARARTAVHKAPLLEELMHESDLLAAQIALENARGPKQVSPEVKELEAQRLRVLEQAYAEMKKLHRNARTELDTVRDVTATFFAAWRAKADTKEERIKVIEKEVNEAEELVEYAKERRAAGRGMTLAVLMYQVDLLDAQIMLANAKSSE